jgi:hypothetical protein
VPQMHSAQNGHARTCCGVSPDGPGDQGFFEAYEVAIPVSIERAACRAGLSFWRLPQSQWLKGSATAYCIKLERSMIGMAMLFYHALWACFLTELCHLVAIDLPNHGSEANYTLLRRIRTYDPQ